MSDQQDTRRSRRLNITQKHRQQGISHAQQTAAGHYVVTTDDGETFHLDGDLSECTCGNCEAYTPSMGTPLKTSAFERKQAHCDHARVVHDAVDSPCSECGHTVHRVREHTDSSGRVVLAEKDCSNCGAPVDSLF